MSEITRRNLLAGVAAAAACAALPAAAITKQGLDFDQFLEVAIAETERLHPGANADRRGTYLKSGQRRRRFHDQLDVAVRVQTGEDDGKRL